MGESKPMAKPTIDDQFWFDYSKGVVQDAPTKFGDAADKLQNVVTWVWAGYTTVAVASAQLNKNVYPWWVVLAIAVPVPLLFAAYWACAWVRMPLSKAFHPAIPAEIRNAYGKAVESRKRKLLIAM